MKCAAGQDSSINREKIKLCPGAGDPYVTDTSEKFHTCMGFKKVGEFHRCGYKFNRWYGIIWMEKIIGAHGKKTVKTAPSI
ncbi:MAG: GNAT family N-acetyltransferase [Treponema sp.]